MTEEQLRANGFKPCAAPPDGWHDRPGTVYSRPVPKGHAYVYCLPDEPGMVEAFVGNWQRPAAYCRGQVNSVEQLLWLLA